MNEIKKKNLIWVNIPDSLIQSFFGKNEWIKKWFQEYCKSREWAKNNPEWFSKTIFDMQNDILTKGKNNIFYTYATPKVSRKKNKDEEYKVDFLNNQPNDKSESLIKILSIPQNKWNKCKSKKLEGCNYTNASLLQKNDLKMLDDLSNRGINYANFLWKKGDWGNLTPFLEGKCNEESSCYELSYTPIIKTMRYKRIKKILKIEWKLLEYNAKIITELLIKKFKGEKVKLDPIWFQGFHLSPYGDKKPNFSQPYLHLHTLSITLLKSNSKFFLLKTCPFFVVYQTIKKNSC